MTAPPQCPSPAEAGELPLDELAVQLLAFMRAKDRPFEQIRNVISATVWHEHVTAHGGNMPAFLKLLQEAWDWLYCHGLISGGEPSQSTDTWWTFITRSGQRVLDDPNGKATSASRDEPLEFRDDVIKLFRERAGPAREMRRRRSKRLRVPA